MAAQALVAVTAEDGEAGNDSVAGRHVGYVLPHTLDRAGGLVAEDSGHWRRVPALEEVEVAVTDSTGPGANQHLPWARAVELDLLDLKRPIDLS